MSYVIAGAGPAGVIAAETLRTTDPETPVIVIGDEPEPAYSRMALPYLLAGKIGEEGCYLRPDPGHWERLGIEMRRGKVTSVDAGGHTLGLADGTSLAYRRLLIATGSHTVRPPIAGIDLPGIENCWTLADARRIAEQVGQGNRVVLMGAGFIGCIVLEALMARKVALTVVEMEDRMVPRMMDATGGELLKRWCQQQGIRVMTSTRVESISEHGGALALQLGDGQQLQADLVVCATGVKPNIDFLAGTGVDTDIGVLVDRHLETSVADIYAAGDVAQGPVFHGSAQEVHAIQPTASEHGQVAGLNMAGQSLRYHGSLSMNVLNTLGLISCSFGQWMGVEGGDHAEVVDQHASRYLRLEFDGEVLVGAIALGLTEHVGVVRGLIQSRAELGGWKKRLMHDPHQLMESYLQRVASQPAAA